jgi:hypothetical protein
VLFKDAQSPDQQSLRNLLLVHTTPSAPSGPSARTPAQTMIHRTCLTRYELEWELTL